METILNSFKDRKIGKCSLEVKTTNEAAIFIHKQIGFQIERTIENYYDNGADAYKMRKEII